MRSILPACVLLLGSWEGIAEVKTVASAEELARLFSGPVDSLAVLLAPGTYDLTPRSFTDSTCGNCEDPGTPVEATLGLHLRGRFIRLTGPEDRSAIIRTHAGYGIFVEGCDSAIIERLTITAGERDTSGKATDAAVVVRNAVAVLRGNRIVDNIGDPAIVAKGVVGIMGVCGRERSRLLISGNEIIRNSWDGIALFRDAEAKIEANVIDGVDKARGGVIGGGRGVAIGVTWNARAEIRGNLVRRYWKGIGLFVDAYGVVERNIVEDIITWGISVWDAGKGAPTGFVRSNIIYHTGACGASITRSVEAARPGEFVNNIIVESGQDPKYDAADYYCYQCALALHAIPAYFRIEGNIFHNNRRATADLPDRDMDPKEFVELVKRYCHSLTEHPVLQQAGFVRDFCFQR